MKCMHCGSEWNSNTAVNACPFCKKPLKPAANEPQNLKSVLVQLRDQLGIQNFGNGKVLVSGFKDLAPELKKEQTMLSYLERDDGVKTLYQVKDKSWQEQNLAVNKVVRHMVDDLMVSESAAQTVCKTYMQVLTGREKEAQQEANSPEELAAYRAKLTRKLKEQVPVQKATARTPTLEPVVIPKPQAKPQPDVQNTTYHNKGVNERTVVTDSPKPKQPVANNRAYKNEQPPLSAPKAPVTPPPPITPPTPPVTPQPAPAAQQTASKKKTNFFTKLMSRLMFFAWGGAIYFYIVGIEPLNTDGSFYGIIPFVILFYWLGILLCKKGHPFWGFILLTGAAGNLIMFYQFASDTTVNNIIQIAYPIFCAITSICHGPLFRRFKK